MPSIFPRMSGWIVAIAATLLLLNTTPAHAIKVSPPPARTYVAQTWIGFSVDDSATLRLELKADGTGSGVLVEYEETQTFRVTSWKLDVDVLVVDLMLEGETSTSARLRGKFKRYLLSYTIGMLPHPEKIHERDVPGPLELAFEGNPVRFGLWPESELIKRLERARTVGRKPWSK